MKNFSLTICLFLFSLQCLLSQENFTPGYIISGKSDTLYGKIDYRRWLQNPDRIYFMNGSGIKSAYKPGDISGFGYT